MYFVYTEAVLLDYVLELSENLLVCWFVGLLKVDYVLELSVFHLRLYLKFLFLLLKIIYLFLF